MSDEEKTCGNCGMGVDLGSKERGWVTCVELKNPVRADQPAPNCWEKPKYR